MTTDLLQPVIVLVAWTLVMMLWLFAMRIPAMQKAKVDLSDPKKAREQMAELPAPAVNASDNYSHLMEQPTVFYALVIAIAVAGIGTGLDVMLAWAYTGLRIVHSIWQATINIIMIRFVIFLLSSAVLIALAIRALMAIF